MSHRKPLHTRPLFSFIQTLALSSGLIFFAHPTNAEAPPPFAFSFGSNQIPGGILPVAVGSDEAGKIYISSLWNVIKVNTNGSLLTRWGNQGTGPGQFSYAGQMALDGAGQLYVIDDYNNRIEEFSTNGNFVRAWGSTGTGPGQFDQPGGLAFSRSGRVYVSDTLNGRIQIFDSSGVFVNQFGGVGTNSGQFDFPGVIAVDSSNHLYVVDTPWGNTRVQKFDADGNFLLEWNLVNTNNTGTIEIGGMTTDSQNNLYIADTADNVIQKYSSEGVFLAQWGSPGSGPGQFNGPMGVALDPTDNYVYVADYYNARIDVFAYAGAGPLLYEDLTNQVVPTGVTLTLSAGAFGAQPLVYQWYFKGAALPGAVESDLVISNAALADSGSYSFTVSNALGYAASSTAQITVLPVVVATLPAGSLSATSAVLYGSAWAGDLPTIAWFEWGTNATYGNISSFTNLALNTFSILPDRLTNLNAETVYHYRLVGSNTLGVVYGDDTSFKVGLKPSVVSLPAAPSGPDSVVLNAIVNPEARDTSVYFRWGTYSLNQYTATNQLPPVTTPLAVQSQISGLKLGLLYQAQPVASNDLGTVAGSTVSFIAPPWVLLQVPPDHVWASLTVSAEGTRLAAVARGSQIFISTNSGESWLTNNLQLGNWQTVVMSPDASRLLVTAAGVTVRGPVYLSTNLAKSWTKANGPDRNWQGFAASGDGLRWAAIDLVGQEVLTSTNGGLDWATNTPPLQANWDAIASSADGLRLIVAAGGSNGTNSSVYTSMDAGHSWTSNTLPSAAWRAVASSADGQTLLAAVGGRTIGPIFLSTDGGANWSLTSAPSNNWQAVEVSADGQKLAALAHAGNTPVFTSTNLGLAWQGYALPEAIWSELAMSADGSALLAAGDQNIFSLQSTPQPQVQLQLIDGKLSLSWTIPRTPFELQQSADLLTPQWTNVPSAAELVLTNLQERVTLPPPGHPVFFRLHNQ